MATHGLAPNWKLAGFCIVAAIFGVAGYADAAVFSVGPNGTYATIQAGINAALVGGGNDEVRVQSGNYSEHLFVVQSSGALTISGGWNSTFTSRGGAPSATNVNGTVNGRVLNVSISAGTLDVANFAFVAGSASRTGGGVSLQASGTAYARLHDLILALNQVNATGTDDARGGGAYVRLSNDAAVQFDHNEVTTNAASADQVAYGGGLYVDAQDGSNAIIQFNRFGDNVINTDGAQFSLSQGAGAVLVLTDGARASFTDNLVEANRMNVPLASAGASGTWLFVICGISQTCDIGAHRNRWRGNLDGHAQVGVEIAEQSATALLAKVTNSLIDGGNSIGMDAISFNTAMRIDLVNLTMANNSGFGIRATGIVALSNSIVFGNAAGQTDLSIDTQTSNNLVGVNPLFLNAGAGNYRISAASPARDAGRVDPPGGIGLFDLDHRPRVFGASVDIGAYEVGDLIFEDAFE